MAHDKLIAELLKSLSKNQKKELLFTLIDNTLSGKANDFTNVGPVRKSPGNWGIPNHHGPHYDDPRNVAVREGLAGLGKSQTQLAKYLGLAQPTVCNWCRGWQTVPRKHLPDMIDFGLKMKRFL